MISNLSPKETSTLEALFDLVRDGDMTVLDAVRYFCREHDATVVYCAVFGITRHLNTAETLRSDNSMEPIV